MAALDNIASELLKAANVADLNFKKTRDQAERDKAVRLRRIVENLKAISAGGLTPTLDQVLTEGNTSTNTLNVGGITTDYVQLDTAATPTLAPGIFAWNDAYGTADLRLKGNNVTLQLGQETLARVVNKTGSDLLESEYKVVRVRIASEGGAQGQRLAVVLAQGLNDPDSATTLGIVTETIPNNQEGFITVFGNVNNINTTGSLQGETWADGDVLYLSPTTAGGLTKVKPVAPQHMVVMGYVVYAHAINGKIFVKVDNGYELDELHNVLITSPANNDLLQYNSAQQVWKNVASSVAVPTPTLAQVTTAGNTTTNAITVGGLTSNGNVNVGSNFVGNGTTQYVHFTGGSGEFRFKNGSGGGWYYTWCQNGSTGLEERMRLSSGNNLLIGTTTDAGYKLDVNGTTRSQGKLTISTGGTEITGTIVGYSGLQVYGTTQIFSGNAFQIFNAANNSKASFQYINANGLLLTTNSDNISGVLKGLQLNPTMVASANNDVLVGLDINPTFTNGAFTGIQNVDIRTKNAGVVIGSGYGYGAIYGYANDGIVQIVDGGTTSALSGGSYATQIWLRPAGNSGGGNSNYWSTIEHSFAGLFINSGRYASNLTLKAGRSGSSGNIYFNNAVGTMAMLFGGTGNMTIGSTTDAGYKLDVNGTSRFTQAVVVNAGGVKTESGTITAQTGVNSGRMTMFNLRNTGGGFQSAVGTSLAIAFTNRETGAVWSDDVIENIVYSNTAGVVTTGYNFYTHNNQAYNASPVLAMSINGLNVGIGTSTPTDKLHIVDNTNGNKFGRISAGGSDASAAWVAQNDQTDNVVYRVFSSGVTGTQMGINLARSASLMANLGGSGKFLVGTYSSTDFVMGTGNQERMRLVDSTGNFLIGTTVDNGNRLTVNGTIDSTGYRINNVAGYTGILNIPGNPPGQQNVDIQGGIIINIF